MSVVTMTIPAGTAIVFPSPRSRQLVQGTVISDQGTYVSAGWEEDGLLRASAVWKGLLDGLPAACVDERPASAAQPSQRTLFDFDFSAEPAAAPAAVTPNDGDSEKFLVARAASAAATAGGIGEAGPAEAASAVALRLAEVLYNGRHSCYLRDVPAEAVASWREAGFEIRERERRQS
jgi:hypothetical protein